MAVPVIGLLENPCLVELNEPSLSFEAGVEFCNPDPIDLVMFYIGDLFYNTIYPAIPKLLLEELSLFLKLLPIL